MLKTKGATQNGKKPNKVIDLGYKYKLYPTKEQKKALDHQMFVYNICLNLLKKQSNQNIEKENRVYKTAVQYDKIVKRALRFRKIPNYFECFILSISNNVRI